MVGKPVLWIADHHGHSPLVILRTYAKWLRGTSQTDIAAMNSVSGPDRRAVDPATAVPQPQVKHLRLVWDAGE